MAPLLGGVESAAIPTVREIVSTWTRLGDPSSFAGRKYLVAALHKQHPEAPRRAIAERVKQALSTLPAYTIHHPRRKRFVTHFYNIASFYRLFEVDLCDVQSLSQDNDGVRFLLVGVEGASRRIFVETCVNKEGATVASAMRKMLSSMPKMIQVCRSDKGSEFKSHPFRALLTENDIHQQFATNESKCALAERAIAKVMGRVYRYLTYSSDKRYVDALPALVEGLNRTPHAHTRVPALEFDPDRDLYRVWEATVLKNAPVLGAARKKHMDYKFALGDRVRITRFYDPLRKGFWGYFTPEYFTIVARHPGPPRTYEVQDILGRPIGGQFHEQEMILVRDDPDTAYPIHRVWKRRRRGGKREALVSFQSWPAAHKVWVEL